MSKIENRPSQTPRKPSEDVAAVACTDNRVLQDDELDAVAGGLQYKLERCFVKSWSTSG